MTDLWAIEQSLSTRRLEPYIKATGQGAEAGVRLYEWNIAVSAAFYEVLAHLEVGVRNAFHTQLAALAGREEWWDSPRLVFTPVGADMISKARVEMTRRSGGGSAGHLVAALPFGFWIGLLSGGGTCNYEMTLWRPGLHRSLPGYRGTRRDLYDRLNTLRLLRNRIAHHEPIYRRHLAADHENILMLAMWLRPGFARWIAARSRVPALLAARPLSGPPSCGDPAGGAGWSP